MKNVGVRGRDLLRTVKVIGLFACSQCGDRRTDDMHEASHFRVTAGAGTILPATAAPALLSQCTRAIPQGVTSYWEPDAQVVHQLERRLPGLLRNISRHTAIDSLATDEYYRQYVGILRSGRRFVYVNGFHKMYVYRSLMYNDTALRRAVAQDSSDWRIRPVSVCDGGTAYFGVEYDVLSGTFGQVHFNARI